LTKEKGPSRITQCSYGFIVSEPFDPEIKAHRTQYALMEIEDGEECDYITETIQWLIPAVSVIRC
jgi:hypothetical protein